MHFQNLPTTIGAWIFYLIIYVPVLLIIWGILLYTARKLFNFNSRKKAWILLLLIIFSPTLWMIPRIMILGGYYCFKNPEIEFQYSRDTKDNLKILKNGAKIIPIKKYPNAIFFEYDNKNYVYAPDKYYVYAPDLQSSYKARYHLNSLDFDGAKYAFYNFFLRQLANYYEYELSSEEMSKLQNTNSDLVEILKDKKEDYAFSLGGHYYISASDPGDMFSNYFLEPKTLFKTMHAVSCKNDPTIDQLTILLLKIN